MKLGILTGAWKRYGIFDIFCQSIARYRDTLEIIPLCVGSDPKIKNMCQEHDIIYKYHPNRPLSSKFQFGLYHLRKYNPDYVLMLGSDDIVCDKFLDRYIEEFDKGTDFIGVTDCYFYDTNLAKLFYWDGYTNHRKGESSGAGRCFSAKLLNKLQWMLWDCRINGGLDGCMSKRLSKFAYSQTILNCLAEDMILLDIKDHNNISKIKTYGKILECNPILLNRYFNEGTVSPNT